jgi:hypothetical protein
LILLLLTTLLDKSVHQGSLLRRKECELVRLPTKLHDCIVAVPSIAILLF